MVVPSLMQFALGTLGPFLTTDLSLSRSDLGLVTGCFYLAAAVGSPVMGRMADTVGARVASLITVTLAGLGVLVLSYSGSLLALLGGALVGGAASAIANPATNLAISTMPRPHAMLVGVKQSGVQAAAFLAGTLLPPIALATGWQGAFLACAALCALALPAAAAMPRAVPARPTVAARAPADGGAGDGGDATVIRLAVYAALMGAGIATTNTYLVLYAHERVGLGVDTAGALLAAVGLCSVLARITATMLVERAADPQRAGVRMLTGMSAAGIMATSAIALAQGLGPAAVWVGAIGIGLSASAFNGVAMMVVISTARSAAVARSSGRVQGAFFGGLFLSPPLFGLLVDATGAYAAGWSWTILCYCAATAVMVTAGLARHRQRP